MTSFTVNSLSDEIQGLLFRISTGEFGSPNTLSVCSEHLTHALSVCDINTRHLEASGATKSDEPDIPNISDELDNIVDSGTNIWSCSHCTYENNISNNICEMCLKSKLLDTLESSTDVWKCLHCTLINNSIIDLCSICGKSKDDIPVNLTGFNVNKNLENEFA